MKSAGILKGLAIGLAVCGLWLPCMASAASPEPAPVVHDVALRDGGVLLGQVVDRQGAAQRGQRVSLLLDQSQIAVAETDANGLFAFQGLRGGVYQLAAAEGAGAYRVWAPGTAPKVAEPGVLLVAGGDLVRGQDYYGDNYYGDNYYCDNYTCYDNYSPPLSRVKFWLSNPWVVAGIVATAVAVPVGIPNADRGGTPVSP